MDTLSIISLIFHIPKILSYRFDTLMMRLDKVIFCIVYLTVWMLFFHCVFSALFDSVMIDNDATRIRVDRYLPRYPERLEIVEYDDQFNDDISPLRELKNLKVVKFGILFNSAIDDLPDTVESIYILYYFNRPIIKLPSNLKNLTIASDLFQHSLNLPNDVEFVMVMRGYKGSITGPDKMRVIRI